MGKKVKLIMEKTGCTEPVAKYLKNEFKGMGIMKDRFYDNLDLIDLKDVTKLIVEKVVSQVYPGEINMIFISYERNGGEEVGHFTLKKKNVLVEQYEI